MSTPEYTIAYETRSVDGITVHHFPSDDVTRATLAFGVGQRDEALAEQGVLHALEHIVMDAVRRTPIEINASVQMSATEFTASGSPALVAEFLDQVCRALSDPPLDRLPAEAPIIAAEIADGDRIEWPLLAARYGLQDLGSGAVDGPGPEDLTADQVRNAAARWFLGGNAVLVVIGAWPEGLRLPLRPGDRPHHLRVAPRRWPGPHAVRIDAPACLVSVLLPPPTADRLDLLAEELITARVRDTLRHRDGLSYLVDSMALHHGGGGVDLLVHAEPPPEVAPRAAITAVTELRTLLREGPTPEELTLARGRLVHRGQGRDAAVEDCLAHAVTDLLGLSVPAADPARTASVAPEAVQDYLRHLEADLLFLVPDAPELDLRPLGLLETTIEPTTREELPPGERFVAPRLAKLLSRAARQAVVVLTSTGLASRLEGETSVLRWDDVVGVMEIDSDEAVVFGRTGCIITVGPRVYRGGERLLEAVRANVPAALRYPQSALARERDQDFD